jgi:hypothetical protein
VARNCCERLRLATASTSENFSPRGAHEGLCDPGDRRHDHHDRGDVRGDHGGQDWKKNSANFAFWGFSEVRLPHT